MPEVNSAPDRTGEIVKDGALCPIMSFPGSDRQIIFSSVDHAELKRMMEQPLSVAKHHLPERIGGISIQRGRKLCCLMHGRKRYFFDQGGKNILFALEVVIEGGSADRELACNVLQICPTESALCKQTCRGFEHSPTQQFLL